MYIVAQHTFAIHVSEKIEVVSLIPSLQSFISIDKEKENPLFSLTFSGKVPAVEYVNLLVRFDWEEAECIIYTTAEGYELQIYPKGAACCRRMIMSKDFTWAVAEVDSDTPVDRFVAGNFLMMLYAFATAPYSTLMFHASVIRYASEGYLFLGKSGTGKSTHSRLWLQYIPGTDLLNDDNPIIRIHPNGEVWVYGSPWSGKTPCYRNEAVKVKGFVRLRQAPHNRIKQEKPTHAFASLLPSCSCLRQEKQLFDAVCNTVSQLATTVPVYYLECLPDAEAAQLCFSTLSEK